MEFLIIKYTPESRTNVLGHVRILVQTFPASERGYILTTCSVDKRYRDDLPLRTLDFLRHTRQLIQS
jgi:hypothetical protein